ncbi:MAG TPA: valine--tRNA ligase [Tepidisphaeraceae bacterium]|jgi:valyl-tRNA synthetase
MSSELPKAYDPASVEPAADQVWLDEKLFHAEPSNPGAPYSIVIPPPNVTAALHLGHALNNTLQDILTRWHRMKGDNACWFPGTDHAGIATQTVVEKRVLAEEGKRRTDFQRDEFVKKIQAWKDEYEQRITDQLKRMGCSCDWDRQAFTMDETRAKAVREAFFRLFEDGLIYRGKRLVNWDPVTQTALADDEVEMEELDGHFYYLQYPLEDGSGHITVATTRPETMLGDTAVAINPKDPRAAALRGKKILLPIVNRVIPIIEDDYVVLPDPNSDDAKAQFATGFLKVTPAHDPNDYEIGRRHDLPIINVFSPTATISKEHGWPGEDFARGDETLQNLLGMDRFEARRAVVDWFRSEKLLEDVKPYKHSVGHSYRSHVPIEPYLSDQWYVATTKQIASMADTGTVSGTAIARNSLAGFALRATRSPSVPEPGGAAAGSGAQSWEGQLKIIPERYTKTYETWHENIRDWCISRQLWWGHRIPVWSFKEDAAVDTKQDDHLRDLIEVLIKLQREGRIAMQHGPRKTEASAVDLQHSFICVRSDDDKEALHTLEQLGFTQDPDVLDTWFSSGLWPLSTMGWPDETPALQKWNPTNTLCTAREIITLWVSRMVMFNLYFRNALPFNEVFIHAMIQDGEGRKMSKSLGNGVDPLDIIQSHGSDAMRFTLCAMTTHTQDVRMPVERDSRTGKNTSPKFDNGRNFCNKIWNATRFAMMHLSSVPAEGVDETKWSLADRWIVSRFNRTVADATAALQSFRYDAYAKSCYDFFWGDLCDWYLEAIKPAMKDPHRAGQTANVLAAVLDGSLRLMHPMIPFITEFIYWRLNDLRPQRGLPGKLELAASKRLINAHFPELGETSDPVEKSFAQIQEVIVALRNLRNQHKVEPKRIIDIAIMTNPETAWMIEYDAKEMIELLAGCKFDAGDRNIPADVTRVLAGGCEIYIEGLVDKAAEEQRNTKRREELNKQISALRGRLSNESYTKKAPPHLVKQTQDQLKEAEEELAKL